MHFTQLNDYIFITNHCCLAARGKVNVIESTRHSRTLFDERNGCTESHMTIGSQEKAEAHFYDVVRYGNVCINTLHFMSIGTLQWHSF